MKKAIKIIVLLLVLGMLSFEIYMIFFISELKEKQKTFEQQVNTLDKHIQDIDDGLNLEFGKDSIK